MRPKLSFVLVALLVVVCAAPAQQALQAALPGALFLPYEGAGHNTQWEQPQRVAEDIRDFIE